jgi:hypothetical protein
MLINMNIFGGANFKNGGAKHTQAPPNCAYADYHRDTHL